MTTDNTNPSDFEYAGFWLRFGATLIDSLILYAIVIPLLLVFYDSSDLTGGAFIMGPAHFLISYVFPLVATIALWLKFQGTPGKKVLGISIVDANTGETPTPGQCVGRYLAYFLSALPFGLGFLWAAFDKKKQAWHDKLAGTVTVRNR